MDPVALSLLERAEAHLSTQETDKAKPLLDQLFREHVPDARAHVAYGVLSVYASNPSVGLDHFRKALALEPTHVGAAANMANLLALGGDVPSGQNVLMQVAKVVQSAGQADKAQQLLTMAEQLGQTSEAPDLFAPMNEYRALNVDTVGYEDVDGEWMPWIQVDGTRLYNLPLSHLSELKPEADLGTLLRVGWNQCKRDLAFRFECSSRYVAPHLGHQFKGGETVVELGAYLGHFSLFLAQSVGADGRVLAVEFIPENYRVLAQNLAFNFPDTTQAVHCGIWSEDGSRPAYRHMLQANSFTPHCLTGDYHPVEVPTLTVDTLLEENEIESVDLMVITINGSELEAFKGMVRSLPKIKAFAIAARYGEGDENRTQTVVETLKALGYTPTVVGGDHVYATRD